MCEFRDCHMDDCARVQVLCLYLLVLKTALGLLAFVLFLLRGRHKNQMTGMHGCEAGQSYVLWPVQKCPSYLHLLMALVRGLLFDRIWQNLRGAVLQLRTFSSPRQPTLEVFCRLCSREGLLHQFFLL